MGNGRRRDDDATAAEEMKDELDVEEAEDGTGAEVIDIAGDEEEEGVEEEEEQEEEDLDEDDDDGGGGDGATVEEDACCICQELVGLAQQGFLSGCDHRFHFDCIVTWARVTNLCPLCKEKFNAVTRRNERGDAVHTERIRDTKQVFRPDPRDHDIAAQLRLVNDVRCEVCGRGDDEHVLLMCESQGCMQASHTYCLGLGEVPDHAWYCAQHDGAAPARATELLARPATTVSTRRRTRRLASLMSNVLTGGARRGRGASRTTRGRRQAAGLDLGGGGGGRPVRGVALAYALRMSRELQAIQQRADAMFARGDLLGTTLYAPPSGVHTGTRSTSGSTSEVDQLWRDMDESRRVAAAASTVTDPGPQLHQRGSPHRVASTFAAEYRSLATRMRDATSSDHYASTVSLTIPKTARLRMVSQVKGFFQRLNERERLAALDAGCLSLLLSWIHSTEATAPHPHPQVLDCVLAVSESLPVRKQDLQEAPEWTEALDAIANRSEVSLDDRQRAIELSERWREVDPPPPSSTSASASLGGPGWGQTSTSSQGTGEPSLPPIVAFHSARPPSSRSTARSRSNKKSKKQPTKPTTKTDPWKSLAVEYVKAKLYPLYKQSKGGLSREQFKGIVKSVVDLFRQEAVQMQSAVLEAGGGQLGAVAKARLMTLLDRVYRTSGAGAGRPSGSNATTAAAAAGTRSLMLAGSGAEYSATPAPIKRRRTS